MSLAEYGEAFFMFSLCIMQQEVEKSVRIRFS